MYMKLDITKNFLSNLELWSKCLITASVILFFGIITFILITTWKKSKRFNFNNKLILFTASLTISMWCLQFLADYVNNDCPAETWFELLAFSFGHTLKSFGGDDNFLMGIKDVLSLLPNHQFFEYRAFATLLAFCAPITSATILFEVFANFFPKFRLWFLRWCKIKKKYYFSELNERSLALAKSILEKENDCPPVIVFTDVYANKVQESTTELLAEAKRIGAICLRDDITHIQKSGFGERKYFLIDDNEIKNLQTLTNLTNDFNYEHLENSEIFLFCQDYIYTDVEKQVRQKLEKKYENNTEKQYKDVKPTIIPVRQYRNLITNMLEKTPLYEPIIHKRTENPSDELDLNVTILGIGDIGTEMFLTTYWMGQMLNCNLNINVISRESEKEFWGKIDYINPEIRHTTQENDELLRVYKNKDVFADPYCKVKYYSCDIQSDEFRKLLEGEDSRKAILDTHYFLVSLGSDQANLSIANTLKNRIGKYHIENKDLKTIINYVVYNADLSETLNENQFVCSHSDKPDIYMQAVGGVEQVYRAENIFMNDYIPGAEAAAKDYDTKAQRIERAEANINRLKDEYKYWSNIALRLHFKYKVFSVTPFTKSLFDNENDYTIDILSACNKYRVLVRSCQNNEALEIQHQLQWLEHRRWNAFLRTLGYRQTNDYEKYINLTQSHKQTDLKLHPCLVECDKKGIHGILSEDCRAKSCLFEIKESELKNLDLLDTLSYELAQLTNDKCDFKQYDYPNNDYLDKTYVWKEQKK